MDPRYVRNSSSYAVDVSNIYTYVNGNILSFVRSFVIRAEVEPTLDLSTETS